MMMITGSLGIAIKGKVIKELTTAAGNWSYTELLKSFTFFKLLSQLRIERPKDDMARLYLHSIILFASKGKHREFIELLFLEEVQASFKREKLFNESGVFLIQLDHELHTNRNIREIKHWNEIPFDQIEEFFDIYDNLVTGVQTPVQTKLVEGNREVAIKINQQAETLDLVKKVVVEINSKIMSTSQFSDVEMLKSDFVNEEYQRQLKIILEHLNNGQIDRSLEELLTLKAQIWDKSNEVVKFKLLTNIGVCYFKKNLTEDAHEFLVEAYQYDKESNLSISNLVNAYMAVNDVDAANKYLDILFQKHPQSAEGYACLIKMRYDSQPISEILELIPEKLRENSEIIAAIGIAHKKLGNLSQAILQFKKALEIKPNQQHFEQYLIQAYLEKYQLNFRINNVKEVGTETKNELLEVLILIDNFFQKIEKTDLDELKGQTLLVKCFILDCLSRRDEALKAVEAAISYDESNPLLLKQKAMQLAFMGEFDESIEILYKIKSNLTVPDVPLFLGEILRNAKRFEEAVKVLEEYNANLTDEFYLRQTKHILLDVYIQGGLKEKIFDYIENFKDDFSLSDKVSLANANKELGNNEKAKSLLYESCNLELEHASFKEKYFLAEALLKNEMFDEAISIYESITNLDVHSELSVNLIQLYQKVGMRKEALSVMERLRANSGPIRGITEREINIYHGLGDYEKARDIAREYVAKYPKNITIQLHLNKLEIRLENFEAVDAFLEQDIDYWNLDIANFSNYVALLLSRNKREQTFNIVYEYRRLKNNMEAHTAYLQMVLQFPLSKQELIDPKEVNIDCAVKLKNKSGQEYVQILENRSSTDLLENEINSQHPRFKKLLGKRVGDIIKFDHIAQQWTIVEIVDKLKYAFRESQIKTETIYAEDSPIKTFHTDDFWEVIAQFGDPNWAENLKTINKLYTSGQATFGIVANKMNKSPFELWDFLRAQKKVGVRFATGTTGELESFSSFLNKDKILVVDVICLMTIHKLKIFATLHSYFKEILVTTSTYDEILDFVEESKNFTIEGVVNEEVNRLQDEMKLYARIVLPASILAMNSIEKDNRDQLLGKSFNESIILATEENAVFCSDDYPLRSLASHDHNLEVTWTHALIMHLYQIGIITQDEYQDLIIALVRLNYKHTSISKDTLNRVFKTSDYKIEEDVLRVLSVLNGENSSIETAVNVVCHFLIDVWRNANICISSKKDITYLTLLELSTDRVFYEFILEVERYLQFLNITVNNNGMRVIIFSIKKQLSDIKSNFDLN